LRQEFQKIRRPYLEILKTVANPGHFSTGLQILPSSFDKSFRFFPKLAPRQFFVNDDLQGHAKYLKANLFSILAGCFE
jgi:hypothetical protein